MSKAAAVEASTLAQLAKDVALHPGGVLESCAVSTGQFSMEELSHKVRSRVTHDGALVNSFAERLSDAARLDKTNRVRTRRPPPARC